jgi:hypothetical protein
MGEREKGRGYGQNALLLPPFDPKKKGGTTWRPAGKALAGGPMLGDGRKLGQNGEGGKGNRSPCSPCASLARRGCSTGGADWRWRRSGQRRSGVQEGGELGRGGAGWTGERSAPIYRWSKVVWAADFSSSRSFYGR